MSVANTLVVIDPAVAERQSLVKSLLPEADVISNFFSRRWVPVAKSGGMNGWLR